MGVVLIYAATVTSFGDILWCIYFSHLLPYREATQYGIKFLFFPSLVVVNYEPQNNSQCFPMLGFCMFVNKRLPFLSLVVFSFAIYFALYLGQSQLSARRRDDHKHGTDSLICDHTIRSIDPKQ